MSSQNVQVNYRVPKFLRDRYNEVCWRHKVATCQPVRALMFTVVEQDQPFPYGHRNPRGPKHKTVNQHEIYQKSMSSTSKCIASDHTRIRKNYDLYSIEELEKLRESLRAREDYTELQFVAFELKKRRC